MNRPAQSYKFVWFFCLLSQNCERLVSLTVCILTRLLHIQWKLNIVFQQWTHHLPFILAVLGITFIISPLILGENIPSSTNFITNKSTCTSCFNRLQFLLSFRSFSWFSAMIKSLLSPILYTQCFFVEVTECVKEQHLLKVFLFYLQTRYYGCNIKSVFSIFPYFPFPLLKKALF